jgi:TRAP-type uncharacterized transport system substrate-binding protein
MKLKTMLLAAALSTVPVTVVAQDKNQPLTVAAGLQGGGYDKFAKTMAQRLTQRGYTSTTVSNHNGSDAISLAACNNKADVWIAQIDAIYARFNEGCVLVPVADYGTEYAMLLVPPESRIDELSDIDETHTVAVDAIGSGTELFWKTISSIEQGKDGSKDDWSRARIIESSAEQLNTMANFGDIQAAILVRKLDSESISMLLNQGWQLAELWDKDIDDEQFNNKSLYESAKVKVPAIRPQTNWIYEVRSFVGVSPAHSNDRQLRTDVASAAR